MIDLEFLKNKLFEFLYGGQISVREANKYLDRVVEELKLKHEKVSHEDFDNDLESITGIRWKQVKNYKNHPKPGQEIQDNSKVKNFIYEQRKKDKVHLAKRLGLLLGGVAILLFLGIRLLMPRESIRIVQIPSSENRPTVTKTILILSINGLGELKLGMDKKSLSDLKCHTVQVSNSLCTFPIQSKARGEVTLYFISNSLSRASISTQDKDFFETQKKFLLKDLSNFKKSEGFYAKELSTMHFQRGAEKVTFSEPGPNMPKNASPLIYIIELVLAENSIQ
jgi:hypothetical protein